MTELEVNLISLCREAAKRISELHGDGKRCPDCSIVPDKREWHKCADMALADKLFSAGREVKE